MSEITRRNFFKAGGLATAAVAAPIAGLNASPAAASTDTKTIFEFAKKKISNAQSLGNTQAFTYPDSMSPCLLINHDEPVEGGVGPNNNIVAYSTLCTHMGCPTQYDSNEKVFKCHCHFSVFDAEKSGQVAIGQAIDNLPRILLDYDESTGNVTAVGVEGLIYGRQANFIEL
ncbi:arsenate reductase (azurin) small subunit [Thiomicrorhabdus sp. Milos-T2]|uniref:arsenate reductase (azurin) small subunit n=1 Tax=Thiomicrorhabdus sp. Milos-T2 TaxID=90814 RepID=UPI00049489E8|nr:arsenate reductase (azurin) small subunit [Thiomicrorhabdus sp. Milos-T2]